MTKQAVVDEPLPSTDNGDNTDEKQSIWASILRDVKSSTKKAPATKSLVVLGDNESGRTTLVAKLQGNDDPKRGAGLEYHYIDVKDDDRDDTPKLGVWILDGDVACSAPLLKFAIKSETLENTIIILVASMTQPWALLSTLKKWTALIEEHIDRLKIDPTRLREMRDQLQHDFQHYIEPNDSSLMLTSSASSTTIKSGVGGGRVPSSVSSVSLASTTPLSPTNGEEQVILPLADGVLTKSLGIPIIVVITKCDVMSILEKENDYKDEYFDFMQHHLRKFCLEYGAALIYTSVKEKKNIDKLYKYVVHKCYGYPFTSTAAIVERDAIFIPVGWDNPKKVDILLENLHRLKSTDNYSDVFVKPIVRRPLQRDNEIIAAEDDQEFLTRLQLTLNRASSPGRTDEPTSASTSTRQPTGGVGIGSSTPPTNVRRNPPNVTPGGQNTAANEGALANFFNSLLTRKSGGAGTPTTASPPNAQRQTSQSPTTPSSSRLQQHPLTFAVTPPPGRTRTPTSHKTSPSLLNMDFSPKILSPVVEQQSKIETTSSSDLPTTVRTPVEDGEPVKILDITENKQSAITNVEPLHLNHNERQSNDALILENEPILHASQQNTEPIASEHDTVSDTINNSSTEILDSPSRSSSLMEDESNVAQTVPTDDDHRRSSKNVSPSSQLPVTEVSENDEENSNNILSSTQLRSISPSQSDELSHIEDQKTSVSTNLSRSSSPVINDNNKLIDRSPSIDHKSPQLLSSPSLENAQQLNDKEESQNPMSPITLQEKTLTSPSEDTSSNNNNNNNNGEQQDNSKQPLNSSRRNSTTNSSIPSRPLSPLSNEPQQQEDKILLSPVNAIQTLPGNDAADLHSDNELTNNTLDSTQLDTYQEQNKPLSFQTEQVDDSSILVEEPDETLLTNQSPRLLFTSNANNFEEEQQDPMFKPLSNSNSQNRLHSPIEISNDNPILHSSENINSSPVIENPTFLKSSSFEQSPSSPTNGQQSDSPFIEDNLQKSPIDETVLSPFSIPQNPESTQLIDSSTLESDDIKPDSNETTTPSPITEENNTRSRSPSPTIKQDQERSRSVSPLTEQDRERSRTSSPIIEQQQDRSRSPSSITEQKHERDQSPLPFDEQKQQRSRSPSPTIKQEQERNRASSLNIEQDQQRSRSPSPIIEQDREQSRTSSPIIEQQQHERSRSPSPITQRSQERSQSPLPSDEQKQQRSRSSSPITEQNQERSKSPLPFDEQRQQRSRSPSLTTEQNQERSRTSSLATEQKQDRSRSPSPSVKQEQEQKRSRSPSPITVQKHGRDQSPLPSDEQEQERSRPPSPIIEQKEQRSRSSSLVNEEKQEGSRTSSPVTEQDRERSRASSLNIQQDQQRSRSPSPTAEQNQERSRPSSPTIEQEQEQNRPPSPTTEHIQERSRSSSLVNEEKQERSRSSSPTFEQKHEQSLAAFSHVVEETQERSRASLLNTQQDQQRSRSSSPTIEQDQERSGPVLPLTGQDRERSRSPSPSNKQKHERDQSPLLFDEEKQQTSRSSSPSIKQEQERSRSPSPTTVEKQQRSQSPPLISGEKTTKSRSPSPTIEQEQEGSGSPSFTIEHNQEQSGTLSAATELKQQRSQSPSPTIEQEPEQERSRSPSPITEQKHERGQSPSPLDQQKQQRSRTSSPVTEQKQHRSRSPSPNLEQEQQRSRSQSPVTKQEQQRSRSQSPKNERKQEEDRSLSHNIAKKVERSRSPSPTSEQKHEQSLAASSVVDETQKRSRSPSANTEQNRQKSRSPSPIFEEKQERTRSPSPSTEMKETPSSSQFNENHDRSRSSSPIIDKKEQRSRSPSLSIGENEQTSSLNVEQKEEQSQYLTSLPLDDQKLQGSRSPSSTSQLEQQTNIFAAPTNVEKQQRSRSASPTSEQRSRASSSIHEDQRKDSFSVEPFENEFEFIQNENSLTRTSGNHKIEIQSANQVVSSPSIDTHPEEQLDALVSPIHVNQRKDLASPKASVSPLALSPKLEESKSPQLATNFNFDTSHNVRENVAASPMIEPEHSDRNQSPSPNITETHNQDHENVTTALTPLSPSNEHKFEETDKNEQVLIKNDEQLKRSPLPSPLIEKRTEEPLLVASLTDGQETSLVKHENENEISSLVSSSSAAFSEKDSPQTIKSPTFDHHHESSHSAIPIPSMVRRPSITRSRSQSTIARPNTLRFSPNNHDLDGLYMSNEYNDEDEIPEDSEHHHNSAPSTVSVEYRRSSLIHNNDVEQQQTPIDPHDISKRLSVVEKARMEDNDNNDVDSTTSKDT